MKSREFFGCYVKETNGDIYYTDAFNYKKMDCDTDTLEFIQWHYGRDKKSVFYEWRRIDADRNTFQILSLSYAMDKDKFFNEGKAIKKEDVPKWIWDMPRVKAIMQKDVKAIKKFPHAFLYDYKI
jgi:hypothetical protein